VYRPTSMFRLHHNRQMTVASVLLFLLAAFAVDPPDHRCRTQSTRNRQSRTVRLDDGDSHNRWHNHGLDNSGSNTQSDEIVTVAGESVNIYPQFAVVLLTPDQEYVRPSHHRRGAVRARPPPSTSLA
jgi:hypothetical protein